MDEVFIDKIFCTVIISLLLQQIELSEIKCNHISISKSKPIRLLSLVSYH